MPLIPFDPCSGDTEPDDCTVLPDIGEAILALGLVGLEPFLPVGECGYDFHTYLSMNKPVAEFYDDTVPASSCGFVTPSGSSGS